MFNSGTALLLTEVIKVHKSRRMRWIGRYRASERLQNQGWIMRLASQAAAPTYKDGKTSKHEQVFKEYGFEGAPNY
jgi:hypothetical protein